mmetsp:Transcript_29049/g.46969  ORF Transcript_29049/g.46969 Transcript_29049/m.46969 type:complete len:232 (+) Transcript_29049:167-862(+)|eukprot:CAMPEP_0184674544 /NCGR_PEP_ID=MMETSP0308-20130426/87297_1 /TAXON_ID=38269 /ORGANISM="Gloeochaete witrockiana, Strain SAG 46.84" /LENGTH=231 /DNA_ID=CAMNT_0027122157 /DNA_START=72 /DNA_END=767 /DNA_ORIENTATION=-
MRELLKVSGHPVHIEHFASELLENLISGLFELDLKNRASQRLLPNKGKGLRGGDQALHVFPCMTGDADAKEIFRTCPFVIEAYKLTCTEGAYAWSLARDEEGNPFLATSMTTTTEKFIGPWNVRPESSYTHDKSFFSCPNAHSIQEFPECKLVGTDTSTEFIFVAHPKEIPKDGSYPVAWRGPFKVQTEFAQTYSAGTTGRRKRLCSICDAPYGPTVSKEPQSSSTSLGMF